MLLSHHLADSKVCEEPLTSGNYSNHFAIVLLLNLVSQDIFYDPNIFGQNTHRCYDGIWLGSVMVQSLVRTRTY
jgi:hypothetical protein